MGTLTDKKPSDTYKSLLRVANDAGGIDATLRTVEDGEGTETPLQLSTDAVNFDLSGGKTLQINGDAVSTPVLTFLATASQAAMRSALGSGTTGDALFLTTTQLAARAAIGAVIGTDVQAYHANLAALSGLTGLADRLAYFTGAGAMALTTFSAFARTLVDDADAAAMKTTLGLVIGTHVQAYDAELAAIAGLTSAADRLPYFTGSGTAALATFTTAGRNLVDDADIATQRATLGSTTVGDAVFIAANPAAARSALALGSLATLSTVTTTELTNDAVTFAKLQNATATQRVVGRNTASGGDFEEVTATQLLDWIGATRGQVLYRGASAWSVLSPGTNGHPLKTGGAGADPSFGQIAATVGLSDYEEGSWTPTLIGSSTPGAQTYSVQVGRYLRIGNLLFVAGRVTITAKDGAMAGNAVIGGLPYAARNVTNLLPTFNIGQIGGITFNTSDTQLTGIVVNGASVIQLISLESAQSGTSVPVANIAAASDVIFSATYLIN